MNKSFRRGGENDHFAKKFGIVPHISHAMIVDMTAKPKKTIAHVSMPMFEVVE